MEAGPPCYTRVCVTQVDLAFVFPQSFIRRNRRRQRLSGRILSVGLKTQTNKSQSESLKKKNPTDRQHADQ